MACKSILVVDDNENVRDTLGAILTQAGYRVVTTRLICDAIDLLAGECFDLVLLDPQKPDMGGHALLSNLHMVYPNLPVMVLSAYITMEFAEEKEASGTRRYFLKPVDPEALLASINEILSRPEFSQN